MKINLSILIIFILFSCTKPIEHIGDTSVSVFKDRHLYFDMAFKTDTLKEINGTYHLDAGRVLLKKIKLPTYFAQPKVTVHMTLTSNGDPWDKSGSLFVIPNTADLSVLDFENGSFDAKQLNEDFPGIQSFNAEQKTFQPNVELLRFMTPFGVGHFNTDERIAERKPVYIPKWEDNVEWTQDITQLLPLLNDEVYIGVYIDTWTKEGYNFSVDLQFEESNIPNHIKKNQGIIPIVNTTKYVSDQGYYDAFSKGNLNVKVTFESELKNAKLYYITTGHGGHAEGDEFTKKEHIISFNNQVVKQFTPWRDDCAAFRRFNPHSGVWTEPATWKGEAIEERIASSDYSRSNWCPGSDILPEVIDLGTIASGIHEFEFSVPEAQAIDGNKINYWMTSAYIVYDL
ncbi:hypothetical protein A9Q87_00800 [Flavobacteriales bacterium 34_180_T64]|nr:hypothetical protein A9Q87_00800 [Flavobacteriales bacterium 34_180_T64]